MWKIERNTVYAPFHRVTRNFPFFCQHMSSARAAVPSMSMEGYMLTQALSLFPHGYICFVKNSHLHGDVHGRVFNEITRVVILPNNIVVSIENNRYVAHRYLVLHPTNPQGWCSITMDTTPAVTM